MYASNTKDISAALLKSDFTGIICLINFALTFKDNFLIAVKLFNNTRIHSLRIWKCTIPDLVISNLAMQLTKFTSIQLIDISSCAITDISAIKIAKVIKSCTNLHSLSLRNNKITDVGVVSIASAIRYNRCLKTLDLSDNKAICDVSGLIFASLLIKNNSLQSLGLARTGIQDNGCITLALALLHNTTLTSLDMGFTISGIKSSWAFDWLRRRNKNIVYLRYGVISSNIIEEADYNLVKSIAMDVVKTNLNDWNNLTEDFFNKANERKGAVTAQIQQLYYKKFTCKDLYKHLEIACFRAFDIPYVREVHCCLFNVDLKIIRYILKYLQYSNYEVETKSPVNQIYSIFHKSY